jgi:uroporphyrinogen-III synthase
MRIAITRPEEDAGPLKAKLEAMGHEAIVIPLLTIRPRENVEIPDRPWQAVAVTSANGVRVLPARVDLASIRTLTVGPQSLKAALATGLKAEAHGGDVNGLAAFIRDNLNPSRGPILYLSGAETAGDLEAQLKASGFECHRAVLYDAVPADALGETAEELRKGSIDAVLLYSPRTARIWRALIEKAELQRQASVPLHLCLSRNVAAVLPEAWNTAIATSPDEAAILALLEQSRRTR